MTIPLLQDHMIQLSKRMYFPALILEPFQQNKGTITLLLHDHRKARLIHLPNLFKVFKIDSNLFLHNITTQITQTKLQKEISQKRAPKDKSLASASEFNN